MWDGDLWVRDGWGQNLAMFLSFGEDLVRGWPMVPLVRLYLEDMATLLWVAPGSAYRPEGFLTQLARFAAWDQDKGLHLTAHSTREGACNAVALTRHMDARQVAALTGFDVAMVRDVLGREVRKL